MKVCYVDESGDFAVVNTATENRQPVFAIAGCVVDAGALPDLTYEFLCLKRRFYPAETNPGTFLSAMLFEVKGSDLRKLAAQGTRRERRHAVGFLDQALALVRKFDGRLFGRAWVKGLGRPLDGTAMYTSAMQTMYLDFQQLLRDANDTGWVVADSRRKALNTDVSHSVFTSKYRQNGDHYDRIYEPPLFGHSDNHAGLQLVDLVVSAILVPAVIHRYCAGVLASPHIRPGYQRLWQRYEETLRRLQYRYQASGQWTGGVSVSDGLQHRPTRHLFR